MHWPCILRGWKVNKNMPSKIVKIGEQARAPMIEGVNILADAVGATMGPGGRLAALCREFGPVMMTKDGVTVAREIELKDKYQDAGARLCKQVANKCNEQAGDGTTTATVLARHMINQGVKYLSAGGNPVHLKRGMDLAVKTVVDYVAQIKTPITLEDETEVKFIAKISGNDEEVGDLVAKAFIKAGQHGTVSYEEGRTSTSYLETVDGTQFDRGYLSQYFVTDMSKSQIVMEDPLVLLWERKIVTFQEIQGFLQKIVPLGKPILLIADTVEGDAMATLIINHAKGVINVCAVSAPAFGEQRQLLMQDLAVLLGAKFLDEAGGYKLENVDPAHLGTARKVIITQNSTMIVGGAGQDTDAFQARLAALHEQIENSDSKYDKDKLQQRIAKLSGGVVVIKMGAHNEIEMREKKFRYEDAVHATRAALAEGIVPGGGSVFLGAIPLLKKLEAQNEGEAMGIKIVEQALAAPCKQIADNAGFSGDSVVQRVCEQMVDNTANWGFNADNGQYGDLVKAGIVDPAKVGRLALQNASTIAGFFLLTEALIVDDPDAKGPDMSGMQGMMG